MKNKTVYSLAIMLLASLVACKTEDIKPELNGGSNALVTLSINQSTISEDGGTAELMVNLSQVSSSDVEVKLAYTGSAEINKDYSSNLSIVIAAGSLSNTTSILALQDTMKEGNENVLIAIDQVIGAKEDGTQVVGFTIEDDDSPASDNLILNEILYDPSNAGLDGDANGDGVYAQNQDEFIELVNNSTKSIDLSGYKVFDAGGLASGVPNHLVPNGTILPAGKALVIFGGGTPTGTFGGALVQTSTSGDLNLNNAGDVLTIKDSSNNVIISFDITPLSDNPNESYTRSPDIIGDFVQHSKVTLLKFSPGTKIDGSSF
jgi:hypothetical protein